MGPPPGSRSALRIGGLALLGVGAAAAAVGLATMTMGDDPPAPVAQPAPSRVVQPPPPPPPIATAPPVAARPPAATASAVPGYGAQPPASTAPRSPLAASGGAGSGSQNSGAQSGSSYRDRGELRVYNNSLIGGLAARARDDFEQAGWTVTEIGGYPGVIPTSTVYYTPGTNEEEQAQELGREFGLRVEPRFAGIANSSPGIIVIITKEYVSPTSP